MLLDESSSPCFTPPHPYPLTVTNPHPDFHDTQPTPTPPCTPPRSLSNTPDGPDLDFIFNVHLLITQPRFAHQSQHTNPRVAYNTMMVIKPIGDPSYIDYGID